MNPTSDRTTGVFPEPPATRLPTQTTGTGARYGRVTARRSAPAPFQTAPSGASSPAASPGGASQNSGARILGRGLQTALSAWPDAGRRSV